MKNITYKGFNIGFCEEGSVSYGRGMRVFVDVSEYESEYYTNLDNAKAAIDFWESGDENICKFLKEYHRQVINTMNERLGVI